jgi:hypothetical protein
MTKEQLIEFKRTRGLDLIKQLCKEEADLNLVVSIWDHIFKYKPNGAEIVETVKGLFKQRPEHVDYIANVYKTLAFTLHAVNEDVYAMNILNPLRKELQRLKARESIKYTY